MADGRLVGAVEEAEPVGDVPFPYRLADVEEEPGDEDDNQNAGHDLRHPSQDARVTPDRYAPDTSEVPVICAILPFLMR